MKNEMNRISAVDHLYSGDVGELAVAVALLRAGLLVAKPYWDRDGIDLLVFWEDGVDLIPVPVQVKTLQMLSKYENQTCTEGLIRSHLERQRGLCLAIYSFERNKTWLICGADNIQKVHEAGVVAGKGRPGRPRREFKSLQPGEEVSIYVNLTKKGDPKFDSQWCVEKHSPTFLVNAIQRVASYARKPEQQQRMIQAVRASYAKKKGPANKSKRARA